MYESIKTQELSKVFESGKKVLADDELMRLSQDEDLFKEQALEARDGLRQEIAKMEGGLKTVEARLKLRDASKPTHGLVLQYHLALKDARASGIDVTTRADAEIIEASFRVAYDASDFDNIAEMFKAEGESHDELPTLITVAPEERTNIASKLVQDWVQGILWKKEAKDAFLRLCEICVESQRMMPADLSEAALLCLDLFLRPGKFSQATLEEKKKKVHSGTSPFFRSLNNLPLGLVLLAELEGTCSLLAKRTMVLKQLKEQCESVRRLEQEGKKMTASRAIAFLPSKR